MNKTKKLGFQKLNILKTRKNSHSLEILKDVGGNFEQRDYKYKFAKPVVFVELNDIGFADINTLSKILHLTDEIKSLAMSNKAKDSVYNERSDYQSSILQDVENFVRKVFE